MKECAVWFEVLVLSTRIFSRRPTYPFHWVVAVNLDCRSQDCFMVVLRAMETYASVGGIVSSWVRGGHSAPFSNPRSTYDVSLSLSSFINPQTPYMVFLRFQQSLDRRGRPSDDNEGNSSGLLARLSDLSLDDGQLRRSYSYRGFRRSESA